MTISLPETTKTFGKESLVVLSAAPAVKTAVTTTEATAGENISLHIIGSLFPTATTEKVAAQRKMGQSKVRQTLGTTTWDVPALQYTVNPQTLQTSGSNGNEAYEALPEGATRYALLRIGVDGNTNLAEDDGYLIVGFKCGPQVFGESAQDAGAEATVTQEVEILAEYSDGPVLGVITAP